MKILIADKFPDSAVEEFRAIGCSIVYEEGLKGDELTRVISEERPQVLIVRSTKVSREMVQVSTELALIIRAGAGYNTIDVETASQQGVYVANCPGKNAVAVAELAMALMLSIDRRVPENVIDLRAGKWNKQVYSKAEGIYGKTLAVIGTGRIGQELISRAQAFGMKVVAWSRSLTPERAAEMGVDYCQTPVDAASRGDYVSLHLAMTDDTKNMVDRKFLESMKSGSVLINTSRAAIVDEEALLDALDKGNLKAGLDVYGGEPAYKQGEFQSKLASHPSVTGTHHIGASTNQAQIAVADETLNIVRQYLESGTVRNCVNLSDKTPASFVVSVRHLNRVGVLADVLRIIRDDDNNVEKMENIIFSGAQGACANIQIDNRLSDAALNKLKSDVHDVVDVNLSSIES